MGMFSRATRNIVRKKSRTALILAVLSISIALMITFPASIAANQQASQKAINMRTSLLEQYSAQLNAVATEIDFSLVRIPNFGSDKDVVEGFQYYPLMNLTDHYDKLCLIPNVEKVIPLLIESQWVPGEEYDEMFENYPAVLLYDVYGIPLQADLLDKYPSILPSNVTAGRNLAPGDHGVVVLDKIVAGNWSVGVGDTVNVLGQTFTVIGIKDGGNLGLNIRAMGVFMNLEDAQKITNNAGKVSFFQIFADNPGNVDTIVANIKSLYPTNVRVDTATYVIGSASEAIDVTSAQIDGFQRTLGQIRSSALAGVVLVIVVQCAVVFVIMFYGVRERTGEIGTLKAMGSSSRSILGQFVLEGVILSLVAGVIGIAISVVGASQLGHLVLPNFNIPDIDMVLNAEGRLVSQPIAVNISPYLMLVGLGVAVLLGVVGSLYPAWRASRIRPAESMKYE